MSYHQILIEIVSVAEIAIGNLSEQEMSHKKSPSSWSKKEILGHLIDSGINNYQRIVLAQLKEDLLFEGYDQVAWVQLNNYQSRKTQELLKTWVSFNVHLAGLVANVPDNVLTRKTSKHNFDKMSMRSLQQGEASNLAYMIWDYIYHIEHHLSQILEGYTKLLGPYQD